MGELIPMKFTMEADPAKACDLQDASLTIRLVGEHLKVAPKVHGKAI
jgi:hypothetical protein